MKVLVRNLLQHCIEQGIECGYNRSHKHTDSPTKQQIIVEIDTAIWNEIYEYFDLEDQTD